MATATAIPASKDITPNIGINGTRQLLTWEAYVREETVWERYDIVEGVRRFMSSPGVLHQMIVSNVHDILRAYQRKTGNGIALFAPLDVVIRQTPRLQARQPDNLYIENSRLSAVPNYQENGFITVAPNLVVEVLSSSDRKNVVMAKLADFFTIGVEEAWIIHPNEHTVSVMVRGLTEWTEAAKYAETDTLQSATLSDLSAPVADLFRL